MKIAAGFLACCLSTSALGQQFVSMSTLFPINKECSCIKTRAITDTIQSREVTERGRLWQVFQKRGTSRELFRVDLGDAKPEAPRPWNHGIVVEGDLNGDAQPDFSWYGGDDTSEALYLFLSSPHGYSQINIIKTLQQAWKHRHHTSPPDLAALGNDYTFDFKVEEQKGRVSILAVVHRLSQARKPISSERFTIPEQQFLP
jgi:hypothetical protein